MIALKIVCLFVVCAVLCLIIGAITANSSKPSLETQQTPVVLTDRSLFLSVLNPTCDPDYIKVGESCLPISSS